MCLPPLQVLAVTIGNCLNIKVQNTHVQTHMITCLMDLFPLVNGLESGLGLLNLQLSALNLYLF